MLGSPPRLALLSFTLGALLAGCGGGGDEPPPTPHTITYSGNGEDGGTVPVDAAEYLPGDSVTVLGNTGTLYKSGHSFDGWTTQADGGGTSYAAGASFAMGSESLTLHAAWSATPAGAHALQYCSDANPAIWLTPTATFEMAARFTPERLAPFVGGKVTKVLFHAANKSCTIRVYASGTATAPGTVVYEVAVPAPGFSGWHTVEIPAAQQPVVGAGDLWISYERAYTGSGDLGLGLEGRTDQGGNGGWYRSNGGDWIQGYDDVWKLKLEIATQ